jgi:copper homeostasis protein
VRSCVVILEVIVLDAADARAAADGGADRLELVADMDQAGLTPPVATFVQVRSAVELPVRVMLRDAPGYAPRDLKALAATARELRRAGADEFVLGFLNQDGEVDRPATESILEALDDCRWTFHRALDHSRNRTSAWRTITALPGLDQVLTAGSPTGVPDGLPTLRAEATAGHAPRILAGGALHTAHLAPLLAAGVRAFHTGSGVRPGAAWSSPVDPGLVRTWRDHLDA